MLTDFRYTFILQNYGKTPNYVLLCMNYFNNTMKMKNIVTIRN